MDMIGQDDVARGLRTVGKAPHPLSYKEKCKAFEEGNCKEGWATLGFLGTLNNRYLSGTSQVNFMIFFLSASFGVAQESNGLEEFGCTK